MCVELFGGEQKVMQLRVTRPSGEADSSTASQGSPPFFKLNPKVHYHLHNSPPLVPAFSQINPVHIVEKIQTLL